MPSAKTVRENTYYIDLVLCKSKDNVSDDDDDDDDGDQNEDNTQNVFFLQSEANKP